MILNKTREEIKRNIFASYEFWIFRTAIYFSTEEQNFEKRLNLFAYNRIPTTLLGLVILLQLGFQLGHLQLGIWPQKAVQNFT